APPEDTRAWTRAMLLRYAGSAVDSVDWDSVGFKLRGKNYWPSYRKVSLGSPLALTRAETEPIFEQAGSLEEVLDAIDAVTSQPSHPGIALPPNAVDKQQESIN